MVYRAVEGRMWVVLVRHLVYRWRRRIVLIVVLPPSGMVHVDVLKWRYRTCRQMRVHRAGGMMKALAVCQVLGCAARG